MVQHKPTPEEQLLKLIEGTGGAQRPDALAEPSSKASAPKAKKAASFRKVPGFLEYVQRFFSKGGFKKPADFSFSIKTLNQMLLGLVIASFVFLLIDLIFLKPDDKRFLAQVSTSDAVYPVRKGSVEKISSDLSVYKNAAQKRNPFLPPSAVVLPGPADSGNDGKSVPSAATGTLTEALQGIKLVGISWSDNPLAMIEDVTTGRTFFLRKGQEFRDVKVQDISKEKVTVTYQGQEGDLF